MTLISKNIYIDKLDHVVKKYNNKYLSTIKMKPVDINQTHILTLVKKLIIKILNLKLVVFLQVTLQIGDDDIWVKPSDVIDFFKWPFKAIICPNRV